MKSMSNNKYLECKINITKYFYSFMSIKNTFFEFDYSQGSVDNIISSFKIE